MGLYLQSPLRGTLLQQITVKPKGTVPWFPQSINVFLVVLKLGHVGLYLKKTKIVYVQYLNPLVQNRHAKIML